MAVNLGSVYLLSHFGIPEMIKRRGGSIVLLASVLGHACQLGVAAYKASKGGLLALTRSLALDHAADRIRVDSISPGSIHTPMLVKAAAHFSADLPVNAVIERFGTAHPLGRSVLPTRLPNSRRFCCPIGPLSARAETAASKADC